MISQSSEVHSSASKHEANVFDEEANRVRGSMLGLAVCDALGAPAEFQKRGTFPRITSMIPNANFGLSKGCFTDDTSMALCLATSLLDKGPIPDPVDQATKYLEWRNAGYMSSVNRCFDIGIATTRALSMWESFILRESVILSQSDAFDEEAASLARAGIVEDICKSFDREDSCGNGSLMRVLPVALLYPGNTQLAQDTSLTTHPHLRCRLACSLYVDLVSKALAGSTKVELAEGVQAFIHNLAHDESKISDAEFIRRFELYQDLHSYTSLPASKISTSGYVLDTLEAALWAFFTTASFEEGAILLVNLGDDADTVAAVYGGLSGAFYGLQGIPPQWLDDLRAREIVEDVIARIIGRRMEAAQSDK